ncbi:MAG: hypothetical protein WC505_06870 [Patescibacteria group bacterium]
MLVDLLHDLFLDLDDMEFFLDAYSNDYEETLAKIELCETTRELIYLLQRYPVLVVACIAHLEVILARPYDETAQDLPCLVLLHVLYKVQSAALEPAVKLFVGKQHRHADRFIADLGY